MAHWGPVLTLDVICVIIYFSDSESLALAPFGGLGQCSDCSGGGKPEAISAGHEDSPADQSALQILSESLSSLDKHAPPGTNDTHASTSRVTPPCDKH